jgi:protease-4
MKVRGCLIGLLVFFLATSVLVNVGLISTMVLSLEKEPKLEKEKYEEQFIEGNEKAKDKIVVVDLTGLITSSAESQMMESMMSEVVGKLRQAREESSVKAVILRIDSPGGEVNASDVIYHEVKKTRMVKPVIVFMESVCASGGFYAAMGGTHIIANELTITGSIGVIMQTINYKDLIDKIGVKAVTFKSGKLKDLLNGGREITPEESALVQGMIDETYNKFVSIVAKELGARYKDVTLEYLKNGIADGRILSGPQAKQFKLVDELGYFEDAVKKAKELGKPKGEPAVVRYTAGFTLARYLKLLGKNETPALKVQLGPERLRLEAGKLYYLPAYLFSAY